GPNLGDVFRDLPLPQEGKIFSATLNEIWHISESGCAQKSRIIGHKDHRNVADRRLVRSVEGNFEVPNGVSVPMVVPVDLRAYAVPKENEQEVHRDRESAEDHWGQVAQIILNWLEPRLLGALANSRASGKFNSLRGVEVLQDCPS